MGWGGVGRGGEGAVEACGSGAACVVGRLVQSRASLLPPPPSSAHPPLPEPRLPPQRCLPVDVGKVGEGGDDLQQWGSRGGADSVSVSVDVSVSEGGSAASTAGPCCPRCCCCHRRRCRCAAGGAEGWQRRPTPVWPLPALGQRTVCESTDPPSKSGQAGGTPTLGRLAFFLAAPPSSLCRVSATKVR